MKKSSLFSLFGLVLTASVFAKATVTAPAQQPAPSPFMTFGDPATSGWYLGGAYEVNDTFTGKDQQTDNVEVGGVSTIIMADEKLTNPGMGYQVFLGYNMNRFLAIELKYEQIVSARKVTNTVAYTPDGLGLAKTTVAQTKQIVFGPSVLISIPVSPYFTPYFRGGLCTFYAHHTLSSNFLPGTGYDLHTRWSENFVYGMGVKSQWFKWFGVRVEYETFPNRNTGDLLHGNLSAAGYFCF